MGTDQMDIQLQQHIMIVQNIIVERTILIMD